MKKQIKKLTIALLLSTLCAPTPLTLLQAMDVARTLSFDSDSDSDGEERKEYAENTQSNNNQGYESDISDIDFQSFIDFRPISYDTQELYQAISENNPNKVTELLDRGILPIDTPLDKTFGKTALIWATQLEQIDVMAVLLARGASTTMQDRAQETALHKAAFRGNTHAIQMLLNSPSATELITVQNEYGETALMTATRKEHINAVQALLQHPQQRISLEQQDNNDWTALIHITNQKKLDIANLLIDHNANPHAQVDRKGNALQLATHYRNYPMLDLLLNAHASIENNIDIALIHDAIAPALHYAASTGNDQATTLLLEKLARIRKERTLSEQPTEDPLAAQCNDMGNEALFAAILSKHLDTALLLFKAGYHGIFKPYSTNETGALHSAAASGNIVLLDLLIKNGVEVDEVDIQATNTTALMKAAEHNQTETIKFLLKKGASPIVMDTQQYNALIYAARNGNLESTKLLLNHLIRLPNKEAIIAQTDNGRRDVLLIAIVYRHEQVATLLIKAAQLNNADENHYTLTEENGIKALNAAVQHGLTTTIEALVTLGISVDARDPYGYTPLMKATYYDNDSVKTLIKLGATVDAENSDGDTALLQAGKLDIVKSLINAGANINHQNHRGSTPLHLATLNKQSHIVRELLRHKASLYLRDNEGNSALEIVLENTPYSDKVQYIDDCTMLHLLILAGANPHEPNPKTGKFPYKEATPELREIIDIAIQERESALSSSYALAQDTHLPSTIACLAQHYATTEVPNQRAPAETPLSEEEEKENASRATSASYKTTTCRSCTFKNHVSQIDCAMCGLPLSNHATEKVNRI